MDLLAVQGTLKSLLQHHNSKASILWRSAFFIVQLSHPYMTTGKTIALTIWTVVGKVISLLFNMLSRLVGNSKELIIVPAFVQLPSAQNNPYAKEAHFGVPYFEVLPFSSILYLIRSDY